ncbi:5-(carboxyamino)imidazole ribonucleotide synthase [Vagococcus sp.]|uniref:5-(carboxyamino)imidazole ribonucleotide synthase n=1 Tax=Vagococcus sp. TaxID=1933889 RepID=UPI003F9B0D6C
MKKQLKPGSRIGIIGGGQLGQMMGLSAIEKGYEVAILDPDCACPARSIATKQIISNYDDLTALKELAHWSDVVTYEFENVSVSGLEAISRITYIPQGSRFLRICQNRLFEKKFLKENNLPVAAFCSVSNEVELNIGVQNLGYPCVLKTVVGGYDGKGQWVLRTDSDLSLVKELFSQKESYVLEQWIPFKKEVSVIVSGNLAGEYAVFPIIENQHQNNILHCSILPAQVSEKLSEEAKQLGLKIANAVQLVGTMAIELFVTEKDQLIINELAPRPHNSGHVTMEACSISQFDGHIMGLCGWKLPEVQIKNEGVMFNLIGTEQKRSMAYLSEKPDWFFHYYGKKIEKKGRKMGHITMVHGKIEDRIQEAQQTKIWTKEG